MFIMKLKLKFVALRTFNMAIIVTLLRAPSYLKYNSHVRSVKN